MTGHLLLIDASGFAYRAFHAKAPVYRDSDGQPVWAVLGFMTMLWRLLGAAEADKPTHAAAVFDAPGRTFRHDLFAAYKAERPRSAGRVEELVGQFPMMRVAAQTLGIEPIDAAGFEADDVIATLATRAVAAGIRVTIVSSDKDMCQLVRDGEIEIVDPMPRHCVIDGLVVYARQRVLERDVIEKFGVPPKLVPDVQALAGDDVDGIPGISGIGLLWAGKMIRRFGTLENVLKAAANPRVHLSGIHRLALQRGAKDAKLYRRLARLRRNVPLKVTGFATFAVRPIQRSHLKEILRALEQSPKFDAVFQGEPQHQRGVPALPPDVDAREWWREELLAPGQKVPDVPQCGFYRRRLVRGGPWCPARIWREESRDYETGERTGRDVLLCEVAGRAKDAVHQWDSLARSPIPEADYLHMVAVSAWAQQYSPDDPLASPHKAIDFMKVPAPVFKPKRKASR